MIIITWEREIQVWHDVNLLAGILLKRSQRDVEFILTRVFDHVSEAGFHYVCQF